MAEYYRRADGRFKTRINAGVQFTVDIFVQSTTAGGFSTKTNTGFLRGFNRAVKTLFSIGTRQYCSKQCAFLCTIITEIPIGRIGPIVMLWLCSVFTTPRPFEHHVKTTNKTCSTDDQRIRYAHYGGTFSAQTTVGRGKRV